MGVVGGEERSLGCMVLHIGATTCDYIVYQEGEPFISGSTNEGWSRLARDIAMAIQIPLDKAEDLMVNSGSTFDMGDGDEIPLNVKTLFGDPSRLTQRHLVKIMSCAAEEILVTIREQLKHTICRGHLSGGIIITGGGANTRGLVHSCNEIFGVPVRIGHPVLPWNPDEFHPDWSPIIGTAVLAAQEFTPRLRPESVGEWVTGPFMALCKRMFPSAKDPREPEGEPTA